MILNCLQVQVIVTNIHRIHIEFTTLGHKLNYLYFAIGILIEILNINVNKK